MSGRREAPRYLFSVICYLFLVCWRVQATRLPLQISDQTSNKGAWHKRLYNSNCPEVAGPGFVVAAIYGTTRRIILLFEWSKNLLINQDPSGRQKEW
jgi:hypothetical protein